MFFVRLVLVWLKLGKFFGMSLLFISGMEGILLMGCKSCVLLLKFIDLGKNVR